MIRFYLLLICCSIFYSLSFAQDVLPRRAYWGVNYDQKQDQVIITSVHKELSFAKAGIRPNDIILEVNGKQIQSRTDFRTALRGKKAGHQLRTKSAS